jgi:hypothetical protein
MTTLSDIPADLEFVDPDLTWRDVARFWSKVEQRGINECWPWLGETNAKGYGQFWVRAASVGPHRIACALANGPSNGLHALHACDNPSCVNPAHLRWGTMAENVEDRCERNRSARGSRQGTTSVQSERGPQPANRRPHSGAASA